MKAVCYYLQGIFFRSERLNGIYFLSTTLTSTRSFEGANSIVFFLSSAAGSALVWGSKTTSVCAFLLIKVIENVVTIGK